MHENIFCPQQKEKKTKNIETHDFSTPTEWNVEMVNDKVIVTLSGEDKKKIHFLLDYFYLGRKNGGSSSSHVCTQVVSTASLGLETSLVWDLHYF